MARSSSLYVRIRQILESARIRVARSVNTTQVVANWLIGREIVDEEQKGKRRAPYGDRVLLQLAKQLRREYGDGYGLTNLKLCRKFFLIYPDLVTPAKGHTVRDLLVSPPIGMQSNTDDLSAPTRKKRSSPAAINSICRARPNSKPRFAAN